MPGISRKRRCAVIARGLAIPRPFDLDQFLAQLAARRNRRIVLRPFAPGPGTPCGLWIATADADYVFHAAGTTPWHQTHIKMHEIAHMLLGHGCGTGAWQSLAGVLAPDVDPAMVRLILGRTSYSTAEERDAETLASLILGYASAASPAAA